MRNGRHIPVLTYLLVIIFLSCATKKGKETAIAVPYPQPFPDSLAIPFLPGIVSKDSVDFGAAFSWDGQSFYFARSENKQTKIYVTHYREKKWAEPILLSFTSSAYSEADPAFAPDGKLYFISNRPKDEADTLKDYDIWFITPLADGQWSQPENLKSINSDSSEYYISFSANGNLYFSSSRTGGFGEEDIYVSKLKNGQYTAPENLGAAINSQKSEYDPGISAKEDLIILASSKRDDSFGGADLYCSKQGDDKKWLPAINLGKTFNTKTREYCPYFSPDASYFFFSSEGDIKWVGIKSLKNQADRLW